MPAFTEWQRLGYRAPEGDACSRSGSRRSGSSASGESLALRFDYGRPDAPVAELGEFLKAKATEWQELKARLAALEAEDPRIANARAAAEAAIAAGDFDAADAVLAGAEELQQEHRTLVEVRRQAGLRQARADALLLKGDADGRGGACRGGGGVPAALRSAGGGRGPTRRGRPPLR